MRVRFPLTIVLTAIIVYVSLFRVPTPEHLPTFVGLDKLVHVAMYAVLTLALSWEAHRAAKQPQVTSPAAPDSSKSNTQTLKLFCWVYPIFLGGLMEVLQGTCTTYRSAEWLDLIADILGTAIVMLAVRW